MPSGTWANELSLGLGWMTPAQARSFIERAKAAGVLAGEGELELKVDAGMALPRGFKPNPEAQAEAHGPKDPFLEWVDQVAATRKSNRGAVLAEVDALQQSYAGLLDALTAVWVLAAQAGLDVRRAALAR